MDAANNNVGLKKKPKILEWFDLFGHKHQITTHTENTPEQLHWWGMQFYRKIKGLDEVAQRSFPFWTISQEQAITEAKRTNKLPKEERTYWTHIQIHTHIVEMRDGSKTIIDEPIKEIKL